MLPIRQVVLYKHGVGYFHRDGEVEGDAVLDLHFRVSEMNDVLKSLTVQDRDGGLVASISYESTRPLADQLEDVAIRIPDQDSLTGLLLQLKGARVAIEVDSKTVEGVVAGIETTKYARHLGLLVDGGTVRSFHLLDIQGITFLDEGVRKDVQHLLCVLIGGKKKDRKRLAIFARGSGKRRIQASYIVETPIWKTSYRILLGEEKASIQGWALVDNTQDEDWEGVSLTLVAGLPISFVHDLYSPRKRRRPVVEVEEEEAYAAPVLEEMLAAGEPEEAAAPPPVRTEEVGALFQYVVDHPVTVRRGESALVPILRAGFDGRRVAVYNPEVRERNPMSAVRMKNTTDLVLEGGPVTVLEGGAYVGESMLPMTRPGEEKLLPFSVELGCTVTLDAFSDTRSVHRARLLDGALHLSRYRIDRKIYRIQNRTDRGLDLYLEHRFRPGWDLLDTPLPLETTDRHHRFRIDVPPKESITFTVNERGDEAEIHDIRSVDRKQVGLWMESRYIDERTRAALDKIVELNETAVERTHRIREREEAIDEILANQKRLRENLMALGNSKDERSLRERYVAEMASEEDQLREHRNAVRKEKTERDEIDAKIRKRIRDLALDVEVP